MEKKRFVGDWSEKRKIWLITSEGNGIGHATLSHCRGGSSLCHFVLNLKLIAVLQSETLDYKWNDSSSPCAPPPSSVTSVLANIYKRISTWKSPKSISELFRQYCTFFLKNNNKKRGYAFRYWASNICISWVYLLKMFKEWLTFQARLSMRSWSGTGLCFSKHFSLSWICQVKYH